MLIAHMPAGYVLSVAALWVKKPRRKYTRLCIVAGLLGSVLPDFDILYFYFIDGRHTFHHAYWTHIPLYWTALAAVLWLFRGKLTEAGRTVVLFVLLGVVTHLALDSVVRGIMWLYPYSREMYHMTNTPVRYGHWLIDLMTHWTFFIELAITGAAGLVYLYRLLSGPHPGDAGQGCLGLAHSPQEIEGPGAM